MGGGIGGLSVGVPEFFMLLMIGTLGVLPWVLGIWALVTLQRVKQGQRVIESKLDALSSRLTRS
jgi:cadmium resistance protein CadD (predicted permease)